MRAALEPLHVAPASYILRPDDLHEFKKLGLHDCTHSELTARARRDLSFKEVHDEGEAANHFPYGLHTELAPRPEYQKP